MRHFLHKNLIAYLTFYRSFSLQNLLYLSLDLVLNLVFIPPIITRHVEDVHPITVCPSVSQFLNFLKDLTFLLIALFILLGIGAYFERFAGETADEVIILLLPLFDLEDGSPVNSNDIDIGYIAICVGLIVEHAFDIDT